MELDRRTVVELAVSVLIILAFILGAYVVSSTYASPTDGSTNSSVAPSITPDGGIALVAMISGFVLLVAVVGLFIYWQDFDED